MLRRMPQVGVAVETRSGTPLRRQSPSTGGQSMGGPAARCQRVGPHASSRSTGFRVSPLSSRVNSGKRPLTDCDPLGGASLSSA